MTRVTAASRLHLGLFRLPAEQESALPDRDGRLTIPCRHFGGAGLMIHQPGIQVSVQKAKTWSARGPLAERALRFAQQFLDNVPELPPEAFALTVERCAPEHSGLGTGTQLGLAVAKALAVELGQPDWDAPLLAQRIGRAERSAIGVHGFQQGGFLVDGGKSATTRVAPLVARCDFPAAWSILLVVPRAGAGIHGTEERAAFAHLAQAEHPRETDALCRLVLLGMLPALIEQDLDAFAASLYDFNRRVGELFKPWQGGVYASPTTAAIVEFLARCGVRGVGQSSWGPTVFAVHWTDQMEPLAASVKSHFGFQEDEVVVTSVANRGAEVF